MVGCPKPGDTIRHADWDEPAKVVSLTHIGGQLKAELSFMKSKAFRTVVLDAAAAGEAEARGDPSFPSIIEQVVQNIAHCVTVLIEHGAVANAHNDRGGDTPLHVAVASRGLPPIIQALLDGHADVDAPNSRGETPLQLAIRDRQKREAIVELLRARGAE